jgi:hypothetical protein
MGKNVEVLKRLLGPEHETLAEWLAEHDVLAVTALSDDEAYEVFAAARDDEGGFDQVQGGRAMRAALARCAQGGVPA